MSGVDQSDEARKALMGNYDPGWNDPPLLTKPSSTNHQTKRTILNKRVAFPVNSFGTPPPRANTGVPPPIGMPPQMYSPPPPGNQFPQQIPPSTNLNMTPNQ